MSDKELLEKVELLRKEVLKERNLNSDRKVDTFFVNALDIVCCLVELAINNGFEIKEENEYWFDGAYHLNFWQPDIEHNLYSPIVTAVRERNFFRK